MKSPGIVSLYVSIAAAAMITASCGNDTPKANNARPRNGITVTQEPRPSAGLDKSPMDMCYFPLDYPIRKMSGNTADPLVARLIYSRPRKDGRSIFGDVVQYGSPWRLGANEATEIEFFRDITIQKTKVNKGRYVIYCIPYADRWTMVLNTDTFTWGLKIDPKQDLYKFDIPVHSTQYPVEVFTMDFEPNRLGFSIVTAWDKVRVALPIQL